MPPVSQAHQLLGDFDWLAAIAMHRETVRRSAGAESVILTDTEADLPGPLHRYPTAEPWLMLWILEVSLAYIASDDFDRDTAFVSPDVLCFDPLRDRFEGLDLGVVVRADPKYARRPLLNGVQLWAHGAKDRLARFFAEALERARALPREQIVWGADTTPLVDMLAPIAPGVRERRGMRVAMIEESEILYTPTEWEVLSRRAFARGGVPRGLVDFKYLRKHRMREFYLRHVT